MLTILQILRKLWIALNGETSPLACGAAVFIGCLMGLTPFGVQTILLMLLLLVFTVPVSLALVSSLILKVLDFAFAKSLSESLGEGLLGAGTASRDLAVWLLDIPVIGLVPLERHGVIGGMVLGAILGAVLWYPVMRGIRGYRNALKERIVENRWYGKLRKFRWLFGGALQGGKLV